MICKARIGVDTLPQPAVDGDVLLLMMMMYHNIVLKVHGVQTVVMLINLPLPFNFQPRRGVMHRLVTSEALTTEYFPV